MPFKKGQSGNPKGRPPKSEAVSDIFKTFLEEECEENKKTRVLNLVGRLYEIAMKHDPKDATPASKELLNRAYGQSPQHIRSEDITGPVDKIEYGPSPLDNTETSNTTK